ncbi:MAG: hypothetical protein AB1546_09100 [bacterium]
MKKDKEDNETKENKPEASDEESSDLYPCCLGGEGAALRFFYEEYTKSQEKSNKDQTGNGKTNNHSTKND